MRLEFDHLVIAAERLGEGVAWAEERLGVVMQAGGKHARYGTHNALLGLEDGLYLEVIAIDPEAEPPEGARWFGLDHFKGPPRLVTWVARASGLGAEQLPRGFERIVRLKRDALEWDMAEAAGGVLPYDQCHPGLIDWGRTPHPAGRLAPTGLSLEVLELAHPEADWLRAALSGLQDGRVQIELAQDAGLTARLKGADGREIVL